jgi:signal transduction histidine kinase
MDLRRGLTWRSFLHALPLVVMTWIAVSALHGLGQNRKSLSQWNQTFDLLGDTDRLYGLLRDAETGQRGYLLTGKLSYLEPYLIAKLEIEPCLARLAGLVSKLSVDRERTSRLRRLSREKMAELAETIALYQSGRPREALKLVDTDEGKRLMDETRVELEDLRSETEGLLSARRQSTFKAVQSASGVATLGSIVVFLLVSLASKRDTRRMLRDSTRINDLNRTLEEKVEQRTQSLGESNRELEAFCYSVSHDLRAPLRGVEGFSKILVRDYPGRTLDERGLDLLKRMGASTVRMGQLIDDLLNLSRVSRSELELMLVDLSALAAAVTADLQGREPERSVEVRIQPGVSGNGDPRLLRVALENLLGNAWKFTRHEPEPRLEFGQQEGAKGVAYFIRDNGAGFDMAHADQLFMPFQRLHRSSEFEGTGIGLATVHRVIERHGGRIWAESAPGRGASFYFTVDTKKKVKHV